ncbi:MAG: type II toxin-antitoxin system VapB family antitoxin [Deltaproteobacteria bacterium]|nr:type II toxin-antitoxin system VapB family antitoxin [Deltaproteobacteria bacterium]
MRTTINIDDDLLEAARALARARGVSLGAVLSELVRRGMRRRSGKLSESGFPVFEVSPDAPPITAERVEQIEALP